MNTLCESIWMPTMWQNATGARGCAACCANCPGPCGQRGFDEDQWDEEEKRQREERTKQPGREEGMVMPSTEAGAEGGEGRDAGREEVGEEWEREQQREWEVAHAHAQTERGEQDVGVGDQRETTVPQSGATGGEGSES